MLNNLKFKIILMSYVFPSEVNCKNRNCTSLISDKSPRGYPVYKLIYRCCLNYHLLNGKCEECPPGTYGSHGMCDKPCPENSYGRFCSLTCQCEKNERCHAVHGCTCTSNSTCRNIHLSTEEQMNVADFNFTSTTACKNTQIDM
ncbi:multiple epidermal growth factor-like domains protein 10 [Mytilus trossulus]|uniref:multiple epidermal growth factor-like domains protein 10 n=1 Tax=Mytilus trossulus TaxID=6551 RepID=UPI003004BF07